MSSPAEIIRQLLLDLNLGEASGNSWPIFVGFLPDTPTDAICVYDTAGVMDGRLMHSGEQIVHPGIQIRVRSGKYSTARSRVTDIATMLDRQRNSEVEIESDLVYLVQNFSRTGDILSMGVEETDGKRHHFTINAITTIRKAN